MFIFAALFLLLTAEASSIIFYSSVPSNVSSHRSPKNVLEVHLPLLPISHPPLTIQHYHRRNSETLLVSLKSECTIGRFVICSFFQNNNTQVESGFLIKKLNKSPPTYPYEKMPVLHLHYLVHFLLEEILLFMFVNAKLEKFIWN